MTQRELQRLLGRQPVAIFKFHKSLQCSYLGSHARIQRQRLFGAGTCLLEAIFNRQVELVVVDRQLRPERLADAVTDSGADRNPVAAEAAANVGAQ